MYYFSIFRSILFQQPWMKLSNSKQKFQNYNNYYIMYKNYKYIIEL